MLAHRQGQTFNASQIGQAPGGASHTTATRYLDTLAGTMRVRRLPPHLVNVGKRLVKAHRVYFRDSGLLHALLGLGTVRDLQAGAAWVVAPVALRYMLAKGVEVVPAWDVGGLVRALADGRVASVAASPAAVSPAAADANRTMR